MASKFNAGSAMARRRTLIQCIGGILVLASTQVYSHTQSAVPAPHPELKTLTQSLLDLHTRLQLVEPRDRSQVAALLRQAAADRRESLLAAIQDAPGEVLRVVLPDGVRGGMPVEVQAFLEQRSAVEGEFEAIHVDSPDPKKSDYRYFLKLPSGKQYSLHFAGKAPELMTGTKIRARGLLVKGDSRTDLGERAGAMAVEDAPSGLETLAAGGTTVAASTTSTTVLPNTFGVQKTLVMLVNFSDLATQPYTADYVRSVVLSTTSNYDLENSFQQTSLTGDVVGWYTLPLSSTVCDHSTLATQAKQAATNAGVVLSNYTRYVYAFPKNACTWWGLGTVGGKPSQAWIRGSLELQVVAHEMGHNFGLYHSHSLDCGAAVLGGTCTASEYGDTLDVMGSSSSAHFNAFHKERLGWLNYGTAPAITTVQTTGDYWLDTYSAAPGANAKALKILKSTDPTTGRKTWFYVEYRQPVGFDGLLSNNTNVKTGVVVRLGTENSGDTSNLLDMTPETASWSDPALALGKSFYDAESGVTITPTWMNGGSATVNVSFGPMACVRAAPAVALSPAQSQWLQPGGAANFTATVTNRDNAGCSPTDFNLSASLPAGWTGGFAQPALQIAPGASASATVTATSASSAASGFYDLPVSAANAVDGQYAGTAKGTVVIATALNVSAATDRASYSRNQIVYATAQVGANGSAVANAAVTFSFTKANGVRVTVNALSDSTGRAVATLRLSNRDPVGAYGLRVDANVNNAVFGSATAGFTVK